MVKGLRGLLSQTNYSEAMERMLKGVVPRKHNEQWALRALILSASEWITENMQQTLQ